MQKAIAMQVYRIERGTDGLTNVVTLSYNQSLNTDDIDSVVPVNVLGGQDLLGLPYLYSKIILKQPGFDQEIFVMNSVQDIQNKMNA